MRHPRAWLLEGPLQGVRRGDPRRAILQKARRLPFVQRPANVRDGRPPDRSGLPRRSRSAMGDQRPVRVAAAVGPRPSRPVRDRSHLRSGDLPLAARPFRAARYRRSHQGISQRSLLQRGARPDAVRERAHRRRRGFLSPRRPASAGFGRHQDRLCTRPARDQQYRQRPRGGAQSRTGEAAGIRLVRPVAVDGVRLFKAQQSRYDILARAEMAILRGQRAEAQAHADAAVRQLQSGTPAWQRAQDIKAYINTRPGKGR